MITLNFSYVLGFLTTSLKSMTLRSEYQDVQEQEGYEFSYDGLVAYRLATVICYLRW
jgi:hypothetical protein